ncbi:unnamed protein product [Leptidea sinapis]|uniref:C2H2-type domain-containing protein n=1 Tax=Leptidea sinapis TaxID=189913 RepID=A0A5E4Q3M6_9NEOP|nr:unnamed protein product [Leptidea sinapis]
MCLKQYANEQNLKRHYKIAHINCSKRYYCNECKLAFKKKHQLSSHMFRHTGIKPFRHLLQLLKRKNMYGTTKYIHVNIVLRHLQDEYICHNCGKVFKQRNHIIRHVKVHMDSRHVNTYFCPFENCLSIFEKQQLKTAHSNKT